jgi:hypothetical protein
MPFLPIEWVERVPEYYPPMAGQNRREQTGFRSGCWASARHRSPTPFRKTECQPRSGQPNHFPTRTDERPSALTCPAMGGIRPLGPSRVPPTLAASIPADGKWTEITPLIWENTHKYFHAGRELLTRQRKPPSAWLQAQFWGIKEQLDARTFMSLSAISSGRWESTTKSALLPGARHPTDGSKIA